MEITLHAISGIPLVKPDDDIAELILRAADQEDFEFQQNDIVVIAHKIVSKTEGQLVDLEEVKPSSKALEIAAETQIDPRHVQVVLDQSKAVLRIKPKILITEHNLGFIGSKAGIDRSNATTDQGRTVVLVPKDPDASARKIREKLMTETSKKIAVIINDSFGRPYREGSVGMAIGISGVSAIQKVEKQDLFGRDLHNEIAVVDEIAAAASILMGQANEMRPVVVVRGVDYTTDEQSTIQELLRTYEDEILETAEQIKKNRSNRQPPT